MNSKNIILPVLCFLLMPLLSEAGDIIVRASSSIQDAIDQAEDGDRILLEGGCYRLNKGIVIEGRNNLTIKALNPDSKVVLTGSLALPIRNLKDSIDIRSLGFTDITDRGFRHKTQAAWTELYADGKPMHLSAWPDDLWVPMDSVVCFGNNISIPDTSASFGIIHFKEDRPLSWKNIHCAWLAGCFNKGWCEEQVGISKISADHTIEVSQMTTYGFEAGQPYQKWKVLNLPEETDQAMEYSINIRDGKAYHCLPDSCKTLDASILGDPIISISNCSAINVEGLEFFCSRGDGVSIIASRNVLISGCEMHGLGHLAITIDPKSRLCGVVSCHLYDLGAGGIELDGGDRKNIVRGDNYVENCIIHRYNRLEKSYRPGVRFRGLGNRVSGCEIFDSPTQAILLSGNDQLVEGCNIHDVCQDVEDMGAIYYGRNPSERGSVIRNNWFHDIIRDPETNVRFVYHDDGACACEVYGNIFERISSSPIQIGGGSHIVYHDNIFRNIDCPAIKIDARLKTWAAYMLETHRAKIAEVDGPAFREHYPEFKDYVEGDTTEPKGNLLYNNTFIGISRVFETVVWEEHSTNNIIEGTANWIKMYGNRKL